VAENDGQSRYNVLVDRQMMKTLAGPLGDAAATADPKYITDIAPAVLLTKGQTKLAVESNAGARATGRWLGLVITPPRRRAGAGQRRPHARHVRRGAARRGALPLRAAGASGADDCALSHRVRDEQRRHGARLAARLRPDALPRLLSRADADHQSAVVVLLLHSSRSLGASADDGREYRCLAAAKNPDWGAEVPAVLVYEGEVTDITARFQGSRYNRKNGVTLDAASYPNSPPFGNFRASSWRWNMPPYHTQYGGEAIVLQKMLQAAQCTRRRSATSCTRRPAPRCPTGVSCAPTSTKSTSAT
jgi:hypothetical protein